MVEWNAMCTLILDVESFEGLGGNRARNGAPWFQHVLASNESKHY
jgi:hypothetical protein